MFNINQKAVFLTSCLLLSLFLFGCREKALKITAFYGLPESEYITEIKSSLKEKKPLAIAFTASWCPHCRQYKPVFFKVKNSFEKKVTFINIDVDDSDGSAVSDRFQVRGIPTTAFVRRDGSVFKIKVGEINEEDLNVIAKELLKSKKKKRGEPVAPFPIEVDEETSSSTEEVNDSEEAEFDEEELTEEDELEEENDTLEDLQDLPMPSDEEELED